MPIVYGSPAYAGVVAETAVKAGVAEQEEKEAERSQRMDIAAMEVQSRRELAQFEADMRTQAAKLSQAWELEKMQRQSELEFQLDQKRQVLKHDTMIQKETEAKEKYLQYSSQIDEDKSLGADEKANFKRMAYDKMVADIDLSEQVYFPEKYAEAKGAGGLFGSGDTGGTAAPVSQSAPVDVMRSAATQAMKELPNAPIEQVEARAAELAKSSMQNEIAAQMQEQGFKGTPEQLESESAKLADIEFQVQQGRIQSGKSGYKPTAYQSWEAFVQGALPKVSPVASVTKVVTTAAKIPGYIGLHYYPHEPEQGTPEYEQYQADKARANTLGKLFARKGNKTRGGAGGEW